PLHLLVLPAPDLLVPDRQRHVTERGEVGAHLARLPRGGLPAAAAATRGTGGQQCGGRGQGCSGSPRSSGGHRSPSSWVGGSGGVCVPRPASEIRAIVPSARRTRRVTTPVSSSSRNAYSRAVVAASASLPARSHTWRRQSAMSPHPGAASEPPNSWTAREEQSTANFSRWVSGQRRSVPSTRAAANTSPAPVASTTSARSEGTVARSPVLLSMASAPPSPQVTTASGTCSASAATASSGVVVRV